MLALPVDTHVAKQAITCDVTAGQLLQSYRQYIIAFGVCLGWQDSILQHPAVYVSNCDWHLFLSPHVNFSGYVWVTTQHINIGIWTMCLHDGKQSVIEVCWRLH